MADTLTYRTTGTYTVALTVHDAGGNNVSTTGTSFSMADAALTDTTPVATVNGTEGVAQTNVTLMTFTDANPFAPAGDFSVSSHNYGGTLAGTAPTLSIVADSSYSGSGTGWKVVADTLTYRTAGTYNVALTVHDAGGNNVSTTGTSFSMADAALADTTPVATIDGTEGVALTNVTLMTFTDADPYAVAGDFSVTSQNFGGTLAGTAPTLSIVADGSYSGSGTGWKVVADTLTYRTAGTYNVALTVHDAGGNDVSTTGTTSFSMADAALTDTTPVATIDGTEGVAQTNVTLMTFTDADPFAVAGDFSVSSQNFGGTLAGTAPTLSIVADGSYSGSGTGWKVVADTLTYRTAGTYNVALTVHDAGGNNVSTTGTSFSMADAALTDTTPTATINGTEGVAQTNVVLMTFTDADSFAVAGDFSVTSHNYGATPAGTAPTLSIVVDGSYSGSGSGWKVVADTLTYAEPGTYNVALTVHDAGGNDVSTTGTSFSMADATVTDTTPTATVNGTEGVAQTNVTLMTFTDANPFATAGDFSVTSHNYGATPAGTAPTLSIVPDGSFSGSGTGWKVVADTLTYAAAGTDNVALTVHDAGGNDVSTTGTSFSLADAALSDTTPVATLDGTEGAANTKVTLMTFTDANPFAVAGDFSVTSRNYGATPAGTAPTLKHRGRTARSRVRGQAGRSWPTR